MLKQNHFTKDERGLAIVEATMLLPFCIMIVLGIFYASIFMCQRANLQANLNNTLIYYKNIDSDTYVTMKDNMAYVYGRGTVDAAGSALKELKAKMPYRFSQISTSSDAQKKFSSFFHSMCGKMFFDDGSNIEVKINQVQNYIVCKNVTATATQTVRPAIDLSFVGFPRELTIQATGTVVVTNGDDIVRNVDLVADLIADTKVGEVLSSIGSKAKELYDKFNNAFNK